MKIEFKYSTGKISAQLPEKAQSRIAIPTGDILPMKNEEQEIKQAFANPIGSKRLSELAAHLMPEDKVVILTSDYTRPTPTAKLVGYVLEELKLSDITPDRVTVMFCAGLHRKMTEEEMRNLLGKNADLVHYECHDAYNSECVFLGTSTNGTPININKTVVDAKLRISLSTVEPHHAAGWSGGGKNVIPGVASAESIFAHHKQMLDKNAEIGVLSGNPFREDIDEVANILHIDFICNVILTEKRELSMISCGDVIQAHRALCERGASLVTVELSKLPDIIIGSPGGAPRDDNLWQTEGKCLTRISRAVRPGGIIIAVSNCTEGVGQKGLEDFIREKMTVGADFEAIFREIRELPFTVQRNKIARLSQIFLRNKLFFVCNKAMAETLKDAPIRFFDNLQDAIDEAVAQMGETANIVAVPETTRVILKLPKEVEK